MANYYRVMLGRRSAFASECFAGGFIGTDFEIREDLTRNLPDEWREFNRIYIPVLLKAEPGRSKIGAGLACGALWTVSKGVQKGDIVLSPDGTGAYRAGQVAGDYYYAPGEILPHRRRVTWLETTIPRSAMSEELRSSTGTPGTVCSLKGFQGEIERLLMGELSRTSPPIVARDPDVEDPVSFALEKHLEDFLVTNWSQTVLSKDWTIYEEDGEAVGQQYMTDAGPIDILAVSRDRKRLLVVELKRGRASDVVVGQVLRYMGYVKEQIAEQDQSVEGIIVALEDDQKLRWALMNVPSVTFYRYEVSFRLLRT